jgi:dTDP-4-amino-4,6-dideoxygalactose transaminase
MSIFREIPPTAGFPLHIRNFLALLKAESGNNSLAEDFKNYLNVDYAEITYSGTAALYLILESLKELSSRTTVIIPSFVCPLVPLAIKRAGLKVEVCDINKNNFNFNLYELEKLCANNSNILAIVAVHLGGIPLDFEALEAIAKRYNIFIIEDCAQALGATYKGKKVGALGDFAFFSLCRGKGLTIYEGGVIVTGRKEYVPVIDNKIGHLVKSDFLSEGLKILELFGYAIFYRPLTFWFIFRLPQIFWNMQGEFLRAQAEYFSADFPIHKVSTLRKKIGHIAFKGLEGEIDKQSQKAKFYIERLKNLEGAYVIQEPLNCRATYPYLTIVFSDQDRKKKVLQIISDSGLGVSVIYAFAITDYEYLKDIIPDRGCPNGRYLAKNALSLSTSTFLEEKDLQAICDAIKKF